MAIAKQVAAVVCGTVLYAVIAQSQSISAATVSRIRVTPMHSKSPHLLFPRVKGLPDAVAQERVNRVLTNREREDSEMRRDCLRSKDGMSSSMDEWIRVRYLSSRFLSVEARETDFGCNAYPNVDIPMPITVDLKDGREVDWGSFFTEGFLPRAGGEQSRLGQLYLQRSGLAVNDECRAVIKESDNVEYGYVIWLDSEKQALMVEPNLPHVVRACAVTIAIPFSEVAPFIKDKSMRLGNEK